MDMFVVGAVAILAAMGGFWAGRSIQWQLAEAAESSGEERVSGSRDPEAGSGVRRQGVTESGADVRLRDVRWQTAAEDVRRQGVTESGADVRLRDMRWQTAAEDARRQGVTESGANVRLRDMRWQTKAETGAQDAAYRRSGRFDRRRQVKTVSLGREIGSPVAGQVSVFEEDGRCRLRILPDQGKVYAPASGRIRRLYPMGSAMLLQTEFGAELLLQAGNHADEMCSGFYHCRVMEHEYVRKGTLLLEYDPAGIRGEGADPEVILGVENEEELGYVTVTAQSRIKVGEPVLYIACGKHSESYEKLS